MHQAVDDGRRQVPAQILALEYQLQRAQLIELTTRGCKLFERSMELQRPWAAALGRGLTASRVSEVCATLEALLVALNQAASAGPESIAAFGKPAEQDE